MEFFELFITGVFLFNRFKGSTLVRHLIFLAIVCARDTSWYTIFVRPQPSCASTTCLCLQPFCASATILCACNIFVRLQSFRAPTNFLCVHRIFVRAHPFRGHFRYFCLRSEFN